MQQGRSPGTRLTAKRALELAEAIQGITYRESPLYEAAMLFIRVGDLAMACRTVELIRDPTFAMGPLRQLACAEARQSDQASARRHTGVRLSILSKRSPTLQSA